jgi:hypothetical protein
MKVCLVMLVISHTQDVTRFQVEYYNDRMRVHVPMWEHVLPT